LLGLVNREPVLEEQDAVVHQLTLKQRRLLEERARLRLAAKAHHPLDPGAVVPAAVKQADVPGRRQVGYVTLKVPLALLGLAGFAQRHHAALARVQAGQHGIDHAGLARGVSAFEQHQHPLPRGLHPARHAHQLQLQRRQSRLIGLTAHRTGRLTAFVFH